MKIGRAAVGLHANGRHEIQPQQREIDEIVAGQRLVAQVGMDEAQAAEPASARSDAADLGQVDARGIAHEDVLDFAAPADEEPDLALELARQAAQERGQLGGSDLGRTQAPPVYALESVLLAGLEARDIAGDVVQGQEVSIARPLRATASQASQPRRQLTTAQKLVVSRFTPPRQISKPVKILVRYQPLWIVFARFATASLMNAFRSNDNDSRSVVLT